VVLRSEELCGSHEANCSFKPVASATFRKQQRAFLFTARAVV
jgi:hypothetical protein